MDTGEFKVKVTLMNPKGGCSIGKQFYAFVEIYDTDITDFRFCKVTVNGNTIQQAPSKLIIGESYDIDYYAYFAENKK